LSKAPDGRSVDEKDYGAPIVSVSLGLPAVFLFGGARRSDRTRRIPLLHGDVVVWVAPPDSITTA
jgi:alkylated DNA repair protein (DNA oxidative demethylase)